MELKNKVIVILGNTRFDSEIQATSLFIARDLAIENKVFFVDYPLTVKDYIVHKNTKEFKERQKKLSVFSNGLLDTNLPNLKIIVTPPVLPINFLPEGFIFRCMLKINEAIIVKRLKKILKNQGISDFIYINSFNFHYPNIAKRIKPTLAIYHCVDPMIVPYDIKHGAISEDKLVKTSDLVICTSRALYAQKIVLNPNTYFVPNATDANYSKKSLEATMEIHEKLKNLPKPIVGYLGTIERRIDYNLMQEVANANTDKSFVFAGPINGNHVPKSLYHTPNIHMLGAIPYAEVPQMMNSFDVAIIPFKKDEVSNTIFPIKLFEYLSAGKPVVITDFNTDLKEYTDDCVEYCSDVTSFSKSINETIKNDNVFKAMQRRALAQQNTWEKRSEQIAKIISLYLPLEVKSPRNPFRYIVKKSENSQRKLSIHLENIMIKPM